MENKPDQGPLSWDAHVFQLGPAFRVWCPIKKCVIAETPTRAAADAALRLYLTPAARASV